MPDPGDATGLGIAVVGIGAIFPRAGDAASFWRNIESGVDAIGDVPPGRWEPGVYYDAGSYDKPVEVDRFYCRRGGFVDDLADFDPVAFGVMPSAVAGTEPDQLLALRATAEAITDAGGDQALGDRSRTGVILGRGGYLGPATARLDQQVRTSAQLMVTLRELLPEIGQDRLDHVRTAFQAKLSETAAGRAAPDSAIGLVPNIAASRIANRLDLHGPAYTVDAACASGLIAVELAVGELASGRCDAVLAGAVHHCHVATIWSVFTQLRALSRSQQIRPFDLHADGTLISEGTGMVLLKRLADAEAAGDRIYAVIRGVGTASDGRATSLMSPSPEGQVLALGRAWASAGLDPSQAGALGLLEAHGTGTPAGDESELTAIARVFGPASGSGETPVLGSVKSMIGHAMPAAGIAGLIKAVLAVHHGVLPPTLHAEEPRPAVAGTRFRLIDRSEPWPEGTIRRAGVNAFGFGGINAHVIVEQAPGPRAARAPAVVTEAPERTVLLAARSKHELLAALEAGATTGGEGAYRLAIVQPNDHRLGLARKVVERGTPWRGRNDVWFTPRPLLGDPPGAGGGQGTAQVAFLFPGFEPDLAGPVDDVADHFGLGRPLLARTGTLVDQSVDIGAVGRLYVEALRKLGIVPDVLAGHSLGEWTAMIVAGMFESRTVDELTRLFRERRSQLPDTAYAALGCGADQALAALGDLEGVELSHDNCPHQSVVCGLPHQVELALQTLRERGVLGQVMPFRSGFHSPMMRPFVDGARGVFDTLGVRPAAIPVWSATSVAPYPDDPGAVRDLVVRHLLEPVHFRRMIEALYESGVRAFVQAGSGSLTGFVEDILAKRDHIAIAAQTTQRGGLSQLRRVVAALWTEGASPAVDRLPGGDAGPPRPARPRMRLDLGTPLVRMGDAVGRLSLEADPTTATPGPRSRAADPVFSAFEAALAEAEASARVVATAWSAAAPPAHQGTGGGSSGPAMPAAPMEPQPAPSILRIERCFSLETMPAMVDHCLVPQPLGWPDPTDRFAVVPIATLLEVMAEAARTRFPDRVVLGFRRIRALRWLTAAPPTTSTLEVHDEVGGHVRVVIPGYADGLVHLASTYPPAPEPAGWPLAGARAPKVDARSLYADGWMFHGPAFAGVAEITAVGDDGMQGTLEALPAPGALLDAAGQLAGHWCHVSAPKDRTVFPTSIASIALFGPQPRPGDRLRCDVKVRELSAETLAVDMELRSPGGTVWARVEAWTYRRFATDDVVWNALKMQPSTTTLGEPQAGGWCLVRQRWHDRASQELAMRHYLVAAERVDYERRKPRAQPTWLLGRIAAKDAVRHQLWDHGHGALFPGEIRVGNDADGRPWIESPAGEALAVSLAHTEGLGVAIVRPAATGRVGIDVEAIASVGAATVAIGTIALTTREHELLDRLTLASTEARSVWMTRFWTAKEAAAKAEGTGLAGRPHDYEVVDADDEHLTVRVRGRKQYDVSTCLVQADTEASPPHQASHVVAWTVDRPPGRNP